MASFKGIKWDNHKQQYYYDDNDADRVRVPINYEDARGNFSLDKSKLDKWFSLDKHANRNLPKYIIKNELEYGPQHGGGSDAYWYLNGPIAVYEPVEWVPSVHLIKQFPGSMLEKEMSIKESEVQQTELWAAASGSLSISASASYMGIQAAAETKIEGGVKTSKDTTRIREVIEHGKIPAETPCFEVMVGILLKMRKVRSFYLRKDDVYWSRYDNKRLSWAFGDNSWSWSDVRVLDYALQRPEVKALQFHFDSTYVQTLPVLDQKKLTGMHIAFSCHTWTNWYAYRFLEEVHEQDRTVLQAFPALEPMSTIAELPTEWLWIP
ncbi:hypothetical protein BJX61DRAFT_539109 [Aspergillus egyptiacus]|nr:hypothetical protein BJX61DRAFT_539109 [Aspergillus egyptiacus]